MNPKVSVVTKQLKTWSEEEELENIAWFQETKFFFQSCCVEPMEP